MPWTDREWGGFCSLVREGWPGEFDRNKARSWRVLLDDIEPTDAMRALKALLFKGSRFRPSPAELIAELRVDPTRPTFDEALAQLVRAIQVRPDPMVLVRGAEWMHPYAVAFLRSFGVDRFRRLEIYDDEYGDLRMRELRDAWLRFEQVAETRERHGLELAPGRNGQLRELGQPVRRLLGGMAPDGEPERTTTKGPTE